MSSTRVEPWRTGRGTRPDVPLPPARMPLMHGRRPLKRWRWIGCFGPDVMLCAAVAHVGPVPMSWWAVWDRHRRTLAENTVRGGSAVRLEGSHVEIADGPVSASLDVAEDAGVETVSPHGPGGAYIWTRKQGGVRATGTLTLQDQRHEIDLPAIVDDSAGYHARHTAWRWSAGVGMTADGDPVAWNLVTGLHDSDGASERTVWIGGIPHELGPVAFDGLGEVRFEEGGRLRFTPEAVRARRDNLLLFASDYEQPFGTFTGDLPHAGRLQEGFGVMERHEARW